MPFSKHFRNAHPEIAANDWIRVTLCAVGKVRPYVYQKTWPRLANRRNYPGDKQQRRREPPINPGRYNHNAMLARRAFGVLAAEFQALSIRSRAYYARVGKANQILPHIQYNKRHFHRVYKQLLRDNPPPVQ